MSEPKPLPAYGRARQIMENLDPEVDGVSLDLKAAHVWAMLAVADEITALNNNLVILGVGGVPFPAKPRPLTDAEKSGFEASVQPGVPEPLDQAQDEENARTAEGDRSYREHERAWIVNTIQRCIGSGRTRERLNAAAIEILERYHVGDSDA